MKKLMSHIIATLAISLAMAIFSPLPTTVTGLVVVALATWQTVTLSLWVMTDKTPAGVGRVIIDTHS